MEIQKEREDFEKFKAKQIGIDYETLKNDLDDCERRFPNNRYAGWNFKSDWELWQEAKSRAVPEKTCSIQGHEIIINETKNELINDYDIAKEDEYLLEALVYRGVCIGKSQAVPEGFVLVPHDVAERCMGHISIAMCHPNNSNAENDVMQMDLDILESKVEAQEQSHE